MQDCVPHALTRRAPFGYAQAFAALHPDLLVVGNLCIDRMTYEGQVLDKLGGAAAFSAQVAAAAGLRAGVVTAAPPRMVQMAPLRGRLDIALRVKACQSPTFFVVVWPGGGGERREKVISMAPALAPQDVPPAWRHAPLAYVAPILNECPGELVRRLRAPLITVGAQGWLRRISPAGWVQHEESPEFKAPPENVRVVIFSHTDHPEAEAQAIRLTRRGVWVVVTRGREGGSLFRPQVRPLHYKAAKAQERDPTGAGDTFGTIFTVALGRGIGARDALKAAAQAAARVVEGPCLGTLERIELPCATPRRKTTATNTSWGHAHSL